MSASAFNIYEEDVAKLAENPPHGKGRSSWLMKTLVGLCAAGGAIAGSTITNNADIPAVTVCGETILSNGVTIYGKDATATNALA